MMAHRPYNLPRRDPGFVYAASNGSAVKFGISRAPQKRVYGLRNASPTRVQLLKAWHTTKASRHEQEILALLAPVRLSGEWFKLAEREAVCFGDCYFDVGPLDPRTLCVLSCILAESDGEANDHWRRLHDLDQEIARDLDPYNFGVVHARRL